MLRVHPVSFIGCSCAFGPCRFARASKHCSSSYPILVRACAPMRTNLCTRKCACARTLRMRAYICALATLPHTYTRPVQSRTKGNAIVHKTFRRTQWRMQVVYDDLDPNEHRALSRAAAAANSDEDQMDSVFSPKTALHMPDLLPPSMLMRCLRLTVTRKPNTRNPQPCSLNPTLFLCNAEGATRCVA